METPNTHWLNFTFFFSKRSLSLFLSLSTLPHLQKKRSRIKPTTAHHRHHHNILPIERGRRERKNLYVICILVKICFWWWRRRSSIVKCFRHIREWESESVSNECARTRIIVKNRSSNTTKTKKKIEMNEMRQKNEHAKERIFLLQMQCQRQLKIL